MQRNDEPRKDDDSYKSTPDIQAAETTELSKPKANLLPMWILFAAVILVGIAWGVSDVYFNSHSENGEVPLIKVEQTPAKVKPTDPGGVDILYRDIDVYEEGTSQTQKAVQLLPPPEEPMQRSDLKGFENNKEIINASSGLEKDVKEDDNQKEPSLSNKLNKPSGDVKEDNSLTAQDIKKEPPTVKSKPVIKAASLKYFIQVSASKNEEATIQEISRFSKVYASLLENYKIRLDRMDLGKKGIWFRIHIGPFSVRTDAGLFCDKLKAKRIGCFIIAK